MNKEIQKLLDDTDNGSGYGDPEARLNDDRKLQILLVQEQSKTADRLNLLTFFVVVVGLKCRCIINQRHFINFELGKFFSATH